MPVAAAGLAISAIGVGLSAASAAGAFNSGVDSYGPTPEELKSTEEARRAYSLGRKIQTPMDALARKDIAYLGSRPALDASANLGVNRAWQQAPQFGNLTPIAAASGGPGSGRWWDSFGKVNNAIDSAISEANLNGRLGGIDQYIARTNALLDRRLADYSEGLKGMNLGADQAATNQNNRINAQIQGNIARSSAMSSIGGSMVGMGSGMMSAGGGLKGAMSAMG